jgi:hypothetical protein
MCKTFIGQKLGDKRMFGMLARAKDMVPGGGRGGAGGSSNFLLIKWHGRCLSFRGCCGTQDTAPASHILILSFYSIFSFIIVVFIIVSSDIKHILGIW